MGITRLANVTGLDSVGVPVFMAIRPASLSLSVAQGKGTDLAAAKASALMEAAETFHAEQIPPSVASARLCDLDRSRAIIQWERLPRLKTRTFSPESRTAWIEGHDLVEGSELWVPHDLVHTDYRLPLPDTRGYFPLSSTGLASGNHFVEAVCVGLMELIERDATTLWSLRASEDKARRRVDMESVDHESCRALIGKLSEAGMAVSAWDLTTDVGIAAFLCRIEEGGDPLRPHLAPFYGAGCHLAREIAFLRALTEAIQTRLTFIAGSRDDLTRREYSEPTTAGFLRLVGGAWERRFPARAYTEVPDRQTQDFVEDLDILVGRLTAIGIEQVIAVDLTRPEFQLPAVRMIAPGLEFDDDDPDYVLGHRARRVAEQREWRS